MVHDDEVGGSYSHIEFSEQSFPPGPPPSDAHVRAILEVVDENPDWKELPHDVLEDLRYHRHDISLGTVTYVLANLERIRSRIR